MQRLFALTTLLECVVVHLCILKRNKSKILILITSRLSDFELIPKTIKFSLDFFKISLVTPIYKGNNLFIGDFKSYSLFVVKYRSEF